uniref:Uncharacterized protein n=1 Tax=viral metagenome TaxID=1070528 RepID=A0A6M3IE30_9ZZZZ
MDMRLSTDELRRIIAALLLRSTTGVCWISADDLANAPVGDLTIETMDDASVWIRLGRVPLIDSPLGDDP